MLGDEVFFIQKNMPARAKVVAAKLKDDGSDDLLLRLDNGQTADASMVCRSPDELLRRFNQMVNAMLGKREMR